MVTEPPAAPPPAPAPTPAQATGAETTSVRPSLKNAEFKQNTKGKTWYKNASTPQPQKKAINNLKTSKYGKMFRNKIKGRREKKNEKVIKNQEYANKFYNAVKMFRIQEEQNLQQSVIMSGIRNITTSIDEILASSVSSEGAKTTISSGIDLFETDIQTLSPLIKTSTEFQALETKIQQLKEHVGSIENMERNRITKTQKNGSRYVGYVIAAGGAGMTITGGVMIKQQLGKILLGTGLAGFLIGVGLVMYSVDRKRAQNQVMAGLESSKGAIENTYLTVRRGVGGIMGRNKFSKLISFLKKYEKLESMILTNRNKLYILKEIKKHTDKIIQELKKKQQNNPKIEVTNPEIEWFNSVTPIITKIYKVVYQEYVTGRVTKETNFMKETKRLFAKQFVKYLIEKKERLLYLQSDIYNLTLIGISLYERKEIIGPPAQQQQAGNPLATAQHQAGQTQPIIAPIVPQGEGQYKTIHDRTHTWPRGTNGTPIAPGIEQMQLTPQQAQQGSEIKVTRPENFNQGKSPDDYFVIQTRYGQVTVYPPAGVNWKKWKDQLERKFQYLLQRQDDSAYDSDEMSVHAQEPTPTSPMTPMTPSSGQRSPRQRSKVNRRSNRRQQAYLPLLRNGKIEQIVTQLKGMRNTKRQSNLKFIKGKTPQIFEQILKGLQSPSSTAAAATSTAAASSTQPAAPSNQQSNAPRKKQASPKTSAFMNYYNKKITINQLRNRRLRNEAATKIQSRFRGRQARKNAQRIRNAKKQPATTVPTPTEPTHTSTQP